jgi:uncharacterized protein YkwD
MSSATHGHRPFRALAAGLAATIAGLTAAPLSTSAADSSAAKVGVIVPRPTNATINAVQWYVNTYRQRVGAPPVAQQWQLNQAAYAHAREMASRRYMTHTGANGSNAGSRISRAGYRWWIWGENVAAGQTTVGQVMGAWYNSAGHRAIILDRRFRHMGLGRAVAADGTPYWCLVFASPA